MEVSMLAPAQTWIDAANVQALLSRVSPADFCRHDAMQIVGPDQPEWINATNRGYRIINALEALHRKVVTATLGAFEDAYAAGKAQDWLDAHDAIPTVQDALAVVLGNPFYARKAA